MSASEQLRELGVRGHVLYLNGIDLDIAPLIADVVEAAEMLDADLETNTAAGSPSYLIAALTALRDSLKGSNE